MKPLGTFFVFAYYAVGLVTRILHPTTVEGLECAILICIVRNSWG